MEENSRVNRKDVLSASFLRKESRLDKQKRQEMALRAKIMMGPLAKYKYFSNYICLTFQRSFPMEAFNSSSANNAFFSLSDNDHGIHRRLFEAC